VIRIRFNQLLDEKSFKERRRIALDEVAARTHVSKTTLRRISHVHGYNTNIATIDALCEYFDCEPADLLVRVKS